MTQLILFDYQQLDTETQEKVHAKTDEIKVIARRTARDMIEIGLRLIEVKQMLPHGAFGPWLESEFEWSWKTATKFINVAGRFSNLKDSSNLNMGFEAMAYLAAPSASDEARAEAIERAQDGETITHEKAKEIKERHAPENKTNFICQVCGEVFSREVWHCQYCDHHWASGDRHCPNCYKAKPSDKEQVAIGQLKADEPELFEQVKTGQMTIPKAKQTLARRNPPTPTPTPELPDNKYRCIVIDPPWPIKKIERKERPNQGVELDYPVMRLDEIANLPISDLANQEGCHLYLWVTQKFLPLGLDLVERWGFRYQCLMTWRKNVGFTPFSWMYDTEHVIFARCGSLPLDKLGLRLSFDAPTVGHSIKPDVFFDERVILASPGPRLEMFARQQREGFEVWGNEV